MCQYVLDKNLDKILFTIKQTENDWRERAFGFSRTKNTEVYLGDCDEVAKPVMPHQIGTFHLHTIDYSRPSQDDYDEFLKSEDKYMCYGTPKDDIWNVKCYDRDTNVCGEVEL